MPLVLRTERFLLEIAPHGPHQAVTFPLRPNSRTAGNLSGLGIFSKNEPTAILANLLVQTLRRRRTDAEFRHADPRGSLLLRETGI